MVDFDDRNIRAQLLLCFAQNCDFVEDAPHPQLAFFEREDTAGRTSREVACKVASGSHYIGCGLFARTLDMTAEWMTYDNDYNYGSIEDTLIEDYLHTLDDETFEDWLTTSAKDCGFSDEEIKEARNSVFDKITKTYRVKEA